MNQKGVVALAVPLLLLLAAAAVIFIFLSGVLKKTTLPSLPGQKKEPTVQLQTRYQNPFEGKFVNPFAGYKNPFDTLK